MSPHVAPWRRGNGLIEKQNEGFEECVFLGAQVAAKVIFVQDQGVSNGFMSRVQYNENGPSGIHDVGLTF